MCNILHLYIFLLHPFVPLSTCLLLITNLMFLARRLIALNEMTPFAAVHVLEEVEDCVWGA